MSQLKSCINSTAAAKNAFLQTAKTMEILPVMMHMFTTE